MTYAPKYFRPHEYRCKCGSPDCRGKANYAPLADGLLVRLDLLRVIINAPITITSGWRCNVHNAATPGASEKSLHLRGRAADITTADMPALFAAADRLNELYLYKFTELIKYEERGFLHVAF